MSTTALIPLALVLLFTAVGQLVFKLYFRSRKFTHILAAILFFILVPVLTYVALRSLSIGFVYMSTAITHVIVVLLARWVLKEHLTADHGIAMVLIISGVILYGWSI